ncbi:MAG: nitronate monooxygenase [Mycobacteriales bacterium]
MLIADLCDVPVAQAPMAGGPGGVNLAAAVSGAGGFGFLAAGYKTADAVRAEIAELRGRTDRPFGVNVFVPESTPVDLAAVARYADLVRPEADALGVAPGEPVGGDDGWDAKLALLAELAPAVVTFTFGCPPAAAVAALRAAGCRVGVTVTSPAEAGAAAAAGVDGLVVQGPDAGAHRGTWANAGTPPDTDLLSLLAQVRAVTDLPLVAAGGLMDGADIGAVLAAGAEAAALGTAFLACPESDAHPLHKAAVRTAGETVVTRAFSGRPARALRNHWTDTYAEAAPAAYPHLNQITGPLRRAAAAGGDTTRMSLYVGAAHSRARPLPAADLLTLLATELR